MKGRRGAKVGKNSGGAGEGSTEGIRIRRWTLKGGFVDFVGKIAGKELPSRQGEVGGVEWNEGMGWGYMEGSRAEERNRKRPKRSPRSTAWSSKRPAVPAPYPRPQPSRLRPRPSLSLPPSPQSATALSTACLRPGVGGALSSCPVGLKLVP